jgi:hypothetical protein
MSTTASVNGGVAEDRAHQKSFKYARALIDGLLLGDRANGFSDFLRWVRYRRKYRKLRHKFKEVMKRSDELFKQEQLAKQAIRRMQEENT